MCSECIRHGLGIGRLAKWLFVDSLEVFRATDAETHGGCVKLQCLLRSLAPAELRAHRALDDSQALKSVLDTVCAALGVNQKALLRPFVVGLDCALTAAHIGMLAK